MDKPTEILSMVIDILNDHEDFNDWWAGVGHDVRVGIKGEIKAEIQRILANEV